jgi:hypothetical protein
MVACKLNVVLFGSKNSVFGVTEELVVVDEGVVKMDITFNEAQNTGCSTDFNFSNEPIFFFFPYTIRLDYNVHNYNTNTRL